MIYVAELTCWFTGCSNLRNRSVLKRFLFSTKEQAFAFTNACLSKNGKPTLKSLEDARQESSLDIFAVDLAYPNEKDSTIQLLIYCDDGEINPPESIEITKEFLMETNYSLFV
jgi:hypothetical protein